MTVPNHDTDQMSERLLVRLRDALKVPGLNYAEPPTRLQGGFETAVYRFQLEGAPADFSKPLVLRLYPGSYGPDSALRESAVQNALAGQGYPAPRSHLVCKDVSVLGGAFFLMDHVPGAPMMSSSPESVPGMLGVSHAELHEIDPAPIVAALVQQGMSEEAFRSDSRYAWLREQAFRIPWIQNAVTWLVDHRPPDPEYPVACHGDFQPLNILMRDGEVTGVVDWPGFVVADAALDVANTIVLTTIPVKQFASALDPRLSSVDWQMAADLYLDAYRSRRAFDDTHLGYYKARRAITALAQGAEGQSVWQHPLIVRDLIECVYDISGVRVNIPTE